MEGRKPKIFILGLSGFLGYQLAWHLRQRFLVAGACFGHYVSIPDVQSYGLDITRPEAIEALVRVQAPDFVINAIGVTDRRVILDQPRVTDNANILLPVSFAVLANKLKAQFIQLSCAEVFEGSTGPHKEEDTQFTMSDAYGKQKLAAESYIRAQTIESTILRVGRVMGLGQPYRFNDFDQSRAKFSAQRKVECSALRQYSYLSADSFVRAVEALLGGAFTGKHRLFHVGGANLSELAFYMGYAEMAYGNSQLVKPMAEDTPGNFGLVSDAFARAYPAWQPETPGTLYLSLLKSLCPGVGVRKSRTTSRTP